MDRIVVIVNPCQGPAKGVRIHVQTGAQIRKILVLIPEPGVDET